MTYLITAYILNIVDYLFTAHWVRKFGIDIEANPFGRWLFSHNVAWVYKIIFVGILFLVIGLGYWFTKSRLVLWGMRVMLAVFVLLTVYHISIRIYIMMI